MDTVDLSVESATEVIEQTPCVAPQNQAFPKWLTINHVDLYQSDKDALIGNEWLNDQHIYVAQNLIKQQHPHIGGLFPTVLQGHHTKGVFTNYSHGE